MCEFCENKVDMGNKPIEDRYGIDLLIDGEFIYAWCECGRKVVKEINYCPMCGRDLRMRNILSPSELLMRLSDNIGNTETLKKFGIDIDLSKFEDDGK